MPLKRAWQTLMATTTLTTQIVKVEAQKQGHGAVNTLSKLTLQRRELVGLGNGLYGLVNLVYLDLSRNMQSRSEE